MTGLESVLLGIVQGLTEFLPVSSSGHLIIGKELLGIENENLSFEIVVHAATVMSTLVAFRKEVWELSKGFFKFSRNAETDYIFKILISMIPVFIVGVFLKDQVEAIFGSGLIVVGFSLLGTALLLTISNYFKPRERELSYRDAFVIGIAQAVAVLPGLSRSGTTISTGLMLGIKRDQIAKFSFLMVLIPVLGEAFLELVSGDLSVANSGISVTTLSLGFVSAFLSGLLACRLMVSLVSKTKLLGFAIYCAAVGLACLFSIAF
ncbi:MAG: undecaprenyl-diphosphate phosphatase [Bacteroidales bacterium]